MKNSFCLEVSGDFACFTRPEMKVERVSYDLITPSAARSIFESILWKPAIRWVISRIEVLRPVRWASVRRNEVKSVVSTRAAISAMNSGRGDLGSYIEIDRQQRAGLFLRDVSYRIYAQMEFVSDEAKTNPRKYLEMFERRADKGQCVNQPYLGCREFAARFRRVELVDEADGSDIYRVAEDEPKPLQTWSDDLGWMLYDMDFSEISNPQPMFFRAKVDRGVVDLQGVEVRQ